MNKLQEPQNKGSQAQEKPTFIMLAAGNSRRFGSNKLLYEIGGVPMYLRTLHKLQKAASELGNCEIIVVTQYEEIASKAQESGVRVLINSHPERGISSSMQIGLAAAKESAACLFYRIRPALAHHRDHRQSGAQISIRTQRHGMHPP